MHGTAFKGSVRPLEQAPFKNRAVTPPMTVTTVDRGCSCGTRRALPKQKKVPYESVLCDFSGHARRRSMDDGQGCPGGTWNCYIRPAARIIRCFTARPFLITAALPPNYEILPLPRDLQDTTPIPRINANLDDSPGTSTSRACHHHPGCLQCSTHISKDISRHDVRPAC